MLNVYIYLLKYIYIFTTYGVYHTPCRILCGYIYIYIYRYVCEIHIVNLLCTLSHICA